MAEKASVVPGIDGSTEESTTKTRVQPNGRPRTSLSKARVGVILLSFALFWVVARELACAVLLARQHAGPRRAFGVA